MEAGSSRGQEIEACWFYISLKHLCPMHSFRQFIPIIIFGPLQLYNVDIIIPILQMGKLENTVVR